MSRAGEIRRLTCADVNLEVGELRAVEAKKNKEFRIVPFTESLRALLEEMRAEATPHSTAPVFGSMDIKKGLQAALKRLGSKNTSPSIAFRHQLTTGNRNALWQTDASFAQRRHGTLIMSYPFCSHRRSVGHPGTCRTSNGSDLMRQRPWRAQEPK